MAGWLAGCVGVRSWFLVFDFLWVSVGVFVVVWGCGVAWFWADGAFNGHGQCVGSSTMRGGTAAFNGHRHCPLLPGSALQPGVGDIAYGRRRHQRSSLAKGSAILPGVVATTGGSTLCRVVGAFVQRAALLCSSCLCAYVPPICLYACMPTYVGRYLCAYVPTYIPPAYIPPTHLPTHYLYTCLCTFHLCTCLPACLFITHTHLYTYPDSRIR